MNESGHEPIIGIDSAYDGANIKTVDPMVLKLAFSIVTYIAEHRNELTDSYCDLIANVAENVHRDDNNLTLDTYADYVLNMTFAYAGRTHYDDIREIVIKFLSGADDVFE